MSVSDSDNDMLMDDGFTVVTNKRADKRRRLSVSSTSSESSSFSQQVPEREERIPPIILTPGPNWQDLLCHLRNGGTLFTAKFVGKRLHIMAKSIISFRAIQKELAQKKIQFHTFPLKEEAELKAVLRGLPGGTDTGCIMRALHEIGFAPTHVSPFFRRETVEGVTKQKETNTYLVRIKKTGSWVNIWKVDCLLGVRVHLAIFKPRPGLPQCFRCQRFHHSSAFCSLEPRCVKCSGPHLRKDCTDPSDSPPKCCNCAGAHPASWKGCPAHKRLQQKNLKEAKQQQHKAIVPGNAGPIKTTSGAKTYAQAASQQTTSNRDATPRTQPATQASGKRKRNKRKTTGKAIVSVTGAAKQNCTSGESAGKAADNAHKDKPSPPAPRNKTPVEQVPAALPTRLAENKSTPATPSRQLVRHTNNTDTTTEAGVKPGYVSAASILKWTATIVPLILGPPMTPNELLAAVMQSLTVLIN